MREWTPPSGLTVSVSKCVSAARPGAHYVKHLDQAWIELLRQSNQGSNPRVRLICIRLHITHLMLSLRIREARRKRFAALANAFEQRLRVLSQEISAMAGPLEVPFLSSRVLYPDILSTAQDEQQQMSHIQSKLPVLSGALTDVFKVEIACETTNVDENDHTVLTHQEHAFGLDLVVQSVIKKIKSIENQNVSGYMTKLTPGRHVQIFRQGWQQYS